MWNSELWQRNRSLSQRLRVIGKDWQRIDARKKASNPANLRSPLLQ
jgi:hypothetical protein